MFGIDVAVAVAIVASGCLSSNKFFINFIIIFSYKLHGITMPCYIVNRKADDFRTSGFTVAVTACASSVPVPGMSAPSSSSVARLLSMPHLLRLRLRLQSYALYWVVCYSVYICVCRFCAYIGSSAAPSAFALAVPMLVLGRPLLRLRLRLLCLCLCWVVSCSICVCYLCAWVVCSVCILCASSTPSASTSAFAVLCCPLLRLCLRLLYLCLVRVFCGLSIICVPRSSTPSAFAMPRPLRLCLRLCLLCCSYVFSLLCLRC